MKNSLLAILLTVAMLVGVSAVADTPTSTITPSSTVTPSATKTFSPTPSFTASPTATPGGYVVVTRFRTPMMVDSYTGYQIRPEYICTPYRVITPHRTPIAVTTEGVQIYPRYVVTNAAVVSPNRTPIMANPTTTPGNGYQILPVYSHN
jgi:hypothetical protein